MNLWSGALAVAVTMLIVYAGMHTLTDKHFVRERGIARHVLYLALEGPSITHSYWWDDQRWDQGGITNLSLVDLLIARLNGHFMNVLVWLCT